METQEKPVNTSTCHHKLCEGVQRRKKFIFGETLLDTTCTCSECQEGLKRVPESLSSIVEYPRTPKTISKGKSGFYLTNTPNTELSETLGLESTSRGPDFYPFWDPSLTEEYRKWWSPNRHNCADLPLNSSSGCANAKKQKSWFSMRTIKDQSKSSQGIYSPFYKYSVVDGMEKNDIKSNLRARKIMVFPTTKQKSTLRQFAGTCRFLFNQTIYLISKKQIPFEDVAAWEATVEKRRDTYNSSQKLKRLEEKKKLMETYRYQKTLTTNKKKFVEKWLLKIKQFKEKYSQPYKETENPWMNFQYARNFLVPEKSTNVRNHPWMLDVPKATREYAIKEAIASQKSCFTNLKRKNIQHFKSPFRRRKNKKWSINVAKDAMKGDVLFPRRDFKPLHFSERSHLREKYEHDMKIMRDENMKYYFVFLEIVTDEKAPENQRSGIMSVDPGIRTRHCVYDTRGFVHFIGEQDINRIIRLCKCLDVYNSKRTSKGTSKHFQRRRYRKQQLRISMKIKNFKDEIDNKTISFMVSNAHTILLPSFETHSMVNRRTRRIRSKTARALLSWRHGEFKKKLLERSHRSGVKTLIVSEHYTSKTCGCCGALHSTLGGNKVFKCPTCRYETDRDVNGARNILLRAIRRSEVVL